MTTDDAVDGPEATNKIPRITAPLAEPPTSALPPLPPLTPLIPSVVPPPPPKKSSPWPWVVAAALLAAGSGLGTWALVDHQRTQGTQAPPVVTWTDSRSPSVSSSTSAAAPADALVAAQQFASLDALVDAHIGFVKAVNRIDRMCNTKPSSGPTTPIPYDHAALAADVSKVHALQDERAAFKAAMADLAGKGGVQARSVTTALSAMNADAEGVTAQTVAWADRALAQPGGCDMSGDEQITADPGVARRNADRAEAWSQFQRFAAHFPVDLASLRAKLVDPLDASNTSDTNLF